MHDAERPIALLSSLFANSNRDPKKRKTPFNYLDYSFYKPVDAGEKPSGQYGAAFIELVRLGLAPAWTLFCYKEMAAGADPNLPVGEPALISEDAVLLYPAPVGNGYSGLLIARESAGNQRRKFISTKGVEVTLSVPYIETKVVAREGEVLMP